ncbi:MAG: CHASE2 domain-containing protein, partial [Cyanobacteria bacterium J06650_10]
LWDSQGWDILFFAGHSQSREVCGLDGESLYKEGRGEILLNETESLTMTQLKHALRRAIDRGLNTAIFNSCDGLGLASDLAELHIPQVLVMREPVPDQVAHSFLEGFLAAFARGIPFYVAVREARERLEGLESRFPCATWLPVIVQNLAEVPPTWGSLQGIDAVVADVLNGDEEALEEEQNLSAAAEDVSLKSISLKRRLGVGVLAGLGAAALALGLRFLGVLESYELKTYDLLLRSRPAEEIDSRLLIITNTAEDIQAYPNTQGQGSLADETLSALLAKLSDLEPQSIGLDIYRDYPAKNPKLAQQLAGMDNLIAICKIEDVSSETEAKAPPPEIQSLERIGSSDFSADEADDVVRRHLLGLAASDTCSTNATFSTRLAMSYGQTVLNLPVTNDLSFGSAKLPVIDLQTFGGDYFGGYHKVDAAGTQLLLNYRIVKEPRQTNCGGVLETPAICMSVSDFLARSPAALEALVKQKIVLIGTTDYTFGDIWITPYTKSAAADRQTPGIFLQAQMISQMISAAMGERRLLTSWPLTGKVLWTVGWALAGSLIAVSVGPRKGWEMLLLRLVLAMGVLVLVTWLLLVLAAVWVPLLSSAIALPVSASLSRAGLKLRSKAA